MLTSVAVGDGAVIAGPMIPVLIIYIASVNNQS